jgi:hypothetical protein
MKTVIAKNVHAEQNYLQSCNDKISACKELLQHISRLNIEPTEKLFKDSLNTVFSHLVINIKKDFPYYISNEKVLELMDISVHKITALETKINTIEADIDFTLLQPISRDFNVYTNSKEAEQRYKTAKELKQAIESAQSKLGVQFYLGDLIRATKGVFKTQDMQTLDINPTWVNDEYR